MNQVYDIVYEGCDIDGNSILGSRSYPAYTCGHCTNVILMRPDRTRDRRTCFSCGRWTCEKSEICMTHCTPMHEMAKDHFEGAGDRGRFVKAIMYGISNVSQAESLGLA